MKKEINRSDFISTATVIGTGLTIGAPVIACSISGASEKPGKPGGPKAFTGNWSGWPIICPENDKITDTVVWFYQNMLLGPKTDMEQIAEAITKIQKNTGEIMKA